MIIDRKFKIKAVNPCNGKIYTEEKVPDTDGPCEVDRCIGGIGLTKGSNEQKAGESPFGNSSGFSPSKKDDGKELIKKELSDHLNDMVNTIIEYKTAEGGCDPNDLRLMWLTLKNVEKVSVPKEEIVRYLFSKGLHYCEKEQLWIGERILNTARLIAINNIGTQDELTIRTRIYHLDKAIINGLMLSHSQILIEELITDANGGLNQDDKLMYFVRHLKISILNKQGENEEALSAINELLSDEEQFFSDKKHPYILSDRYLKIKILNNLDKHEEVLAMIEELLPLRERFYDFNHPDTQDIRKLRDTILAH